MNIAQASIPYCHPAAPNVAAGSDRDDQDPSIREQEALLAHFAGGPVPLPSPMRPGPASQLPIVAEAPLCMTSLQQWASINHRLDGIDELERTWLERRRFRRTERVMLNAALYIAATLIVGAFAFVQLEDTIASSRNAADRVWQTNLAEQQANLEREEREALAAARQALTQPHWTGLLTFVKDSRQYLPKIRDHYRDWSYAPFHEPQLQVLDCEETHDGLSRVRVAVNPTKAWSSTILLEKVNGRFKLNWDSFEGRFNDPATGSQESRQAFQFRLDDQLPNAIAYFSQQKL